MRKLISIVLVLGLFFLTACNELNSMLNEIDPNYSSEPSETNTADSDDLSDSSSLVSVENSRSTSASSDDSSIITITIPEGYTLARIGMLLEKNNICTTEEFLETCETGDFSQYEFVSGQSPDTNRCYELEGYLFPDTYEIYATDSPESIINKMLSNTQNRLAGLSSEINQSGYTLDQIITMASIIEKEALGKDEMFKISSVLHNRLDQGIKLQCDVTINYVEYVIKEYVSGDKNRFNSDYNTYKCAGLPAGAICNPGLEAIESALRPADTGYLYFVTDEAQNFYYSETYEEHLETCNTIGIEW